MTDRPSNPSTLPALALALTRRRLLAGLGVGALAAGLPPPHFAEPAAAQAATPVPPPVDQARLTNLIDLSRTLCGGGNFDSGRATTLLGLLDGDAAMKQGLDELLAAPPVDPAADATPAAPTAVPSTQAQATMRAILLYWYVGSFGGNPLPDRSTAYYGLTAWQAMYTPPFAVCKLFGGWANPPSTSPLVAST